MSCKQAFDFKKSRITLLEVLRSMILLAQKALRSSELYNANLVKSKLRKTLLLKEFCREPLCLILFNTTLLRRCKKLRVSIGIKNFIRIECWKSSEKWRAEKEKLTPNMTAARSSENSWGLNFAWVQDIREGNWRGAAVLLLDSDFIFRMRQLKEDHYEYGGLSVCKIIESVFPGSWKIARQCPYTKGLGKPSEKKE